MMIDVDARIVDLVRRYDEAETAYLNWKYDATSPESRDEYARVRLRYHEAAHRLALHISVQVGR